MISFSVAFTAKGTAYLVALFWLNPSTMKFIYISNAVVLVFFWIPYNLEFFSFATAELGLFLSYLEALSVIPMITLSRFSDRRGSKTAFIYPALLTTGAATISLAFAILGCALFAYAALLHLKRIYPRAKLIPAQPALRRFVGDFGTSAIRTRSRFPPVPRHVATGKSS